MYKVENRWDHNNSVKIEWNLGKRCNYDCSYCPSVIHDNYSPHTDINLLKQTVDKLCEINKNLRISFTGGEPTVHPQFNELIDYLNTKEKINYISVTTNGTRLRTWYYNLTVNQFVFSVHFEYDWEPIIEKIISLYASDTPHEYKKSIVVHVMAHHKHMKAVKEAVRRLDFYSVPYNIRRVRWTEGDHDLFDDMKYDQNDLDWILENDSTVSANTLVYYKRDKDGDLVEQYHANDIIKHHLNQYKGWTCNAGLESLMINWDGDVHRATCRVGGSLGNIYHGSFIIPTDSIVCDRNYCTCAADIPLTKEKLV